MKTVESSSLKQNRISLSPKQVDAVDADGVFVVDLNGNFKKASVTTVKPIELEEGDDEEVVATRTSSSSSLKNKYKGYCYYEYSTTRTASSTTSTSTSSRIEKIEKSASNEISGEPIVTECNSDSDSQPNGNSCHSKSVTPEPRKTMNKSEKISELYTRQLSSSTNMKASSNYLSSKQQQPSTNIFNLNRKGSPENILDENNSNPIICTVDSDNEESSPSTSLISPKVETSSNLCKQIGSRNRLISSHEAFKAQKSATSNQEMRVILSNESKIAEKSSMAAMKAKVESNGFSASKIMATKEDHKQIQFGDTVMKSQSSCKSSSQSMMSMSSENMLTGTSFESKQKEQRHISQGFLTQRKTSTGFLSNNSKLKELMQAMSPKMLTFSNEVDMEFDELSSIAKTFKSPIISKTESINMKGSMNKLENKMQNLCKEFVQNRNNLDILIVLTDMIKKAWSVPQCGYDLGFNMSRIIRETGALEALICNIETEDDWKVTFSSAQLLEQCLVSDNRDYVVEHGLEKVIIIAIECVNKKQNDEVQVGVGILEHLFKHSESTCKEVIKLNGLETILYECRSTNINTLRHCASALANLSLYGGPDSQESMIKLKAAMWLFPLAFHHDDNIKYYACLAITVLVANQELEAEVIKSGTLDLCEPFVLSHNPEEFAKSSTSHIHGQSKNWLARLVPVLMSKREEARSLAAFHFAMEAWIKKTQEQTEIFREINAIQALKKVASCPNAIASKYAAQALRLIGEEVPHKLSQQVPLWTMQDVKEWVMQIGFGLYRQEFEKSRVDGDILLQLNEEMLRDDIGIKNGILRKRFMRELAALKQITDYSSCDPTNMASFLSNLGPEYTKYTYSLLHGALDRNTISFATDDILLHECNIDNTVHRAKILDAAENLKKCKPVIENKDDDSSNKTLDVFISYRRSNGSQLASLLKVHLQIRGFSVFLDVERLEAGKFDNNLMNNIKQAKHFLLVLTPNALDRCLNDDEQKDWVHREIAQALNTKCNIIPIMESFQWPDSDHLPDDIKPICHFNGIRWIHDYQEACVDKLEWFMRGEFNAKGEPIFGGRIHSIPHGLPPTPSAASSTGGTGGIRSPSQQRRSCSVDNTRSPPPT